MPDFLTQAEYSRHRGVSRKTVTQWKREGILVMKGNLVDRAASDQALQNNGRGSVTKRPKSNNPGNNVGKETGQETGNKPSTMKPVPTVAVNSVRETLRENGQAAGSGNMTFMQAKTADMVMRAQLRKIELEERKKSVINRARTLDLVEELSRRDRDSLQNWPARISARMAAELGIDAHRMHNTLEKYVREHLEECSNREIRID